MNRFTKNNMNRKLPVTCLMILALMLPFMCPVGAAVITDLTCVPVPGSASVYGTDTGSASEEIRGVWVSTVKNLDFPSSPTAKDSALKKELDAIVENTAEMGLNAIFFQVRPTADALYDSDLFPWSRYLTGTAGKAPSNGFDPLSYLIEKAHNNNIQVHAWINPYRITRDGDADYESLPEDHPARLHPEYVVKYTDQNYYFDPAIPQVQDLVVEGALEIVENYDVDGIHLDDYFYPGTDFDDSASFASYGAGYSDIGDWRRDNINTLVKRLDQALHEKDPSISFGISPSGIWGNSATTPGGSNTKGKESYSQSYADTKKWAEEGWVDYIAPQIYWNIGYEIADYQTLLDWWSDTVSGTDTSLYIGIAAYKCGDSDPDSAWSGAAELSRQLKLNDTKKQVTGEIFFRYRSLLYIEGVSDALKDYYVTGHSSQNDGGDQTHPVVFTDLDQAAWAREYIYKLAGLGIVSGKGNQLFDPMAPLTRAEFVTMLIKTFDLRTDASFSCSYEDADKDSWSYPYLAAAQHYGILPGPEASQTASGLTETNRFRPDDPITREDMALFACNGLLSCSVSTEGSKTVSFTDEAAISDEKRKSAIDTLAGLGILNGYPEDQTFRPQGQATRAESSTTVCALLDYLISQGFLAE